ncbi:hypothetical protein L7F22_032975 [Adiantum nelumboides]|nr:hypothetical protein [Adiantum nelumboides]
MILAQYDECGGQLNAKKCHLAQPRVKLLGHMVSENGIEDDPDKVKSIILLPSPKSTKQLATFIHKVKYMARFIPLSSQLLYPLQQVAKHDPLQWDDKCEEVFREVKEVLGGLSAMQAPDREQAFYVNPSVGDDAIGAMLLQKGKGSHYMRPVYCASRVKLVAERKLSKVELVMASLAKGVTQFGKRVLKPELRKTIMAFDVFEKWGIDAIGPLPITSRGKSYILTALDYLSRWAKAIAVKQITAKDVAKIVYDEICCKFGVPLELLSDKGPGFRAKLLHFLCAKMKIRHQHTTPYYPQCNGLNERFNGEVVQIHSKVTEHQGKNWDLELPSALWAYRTSVKTGTGFTPFHLVYGKEALLLVEVELPVVKIIEKLLGQSSDAFKERLLQLQEVQLDRMSALKHYGQMQEKALEKINEKIKSKGIKKHDLVLRYNSKLDKTFQKKFQIKWEGPFKVVECFSNGTYQLANLDGALHKSRVNGLPLKLYHARLMMVEQDEVFAEQVMSVRDEETCDATSLISLFTAADHE